MSETEATGGVDGKRGFCNIDGLNNDALADDPTGPPTKKISKSSFIIDLTKTSIQQQEKMMAFSLISNIRRKAELKISLDAMIEMFVSMSTVRSRIR